ncbi:MAG: NAD-dependent epimerase/dehydratase family protein, partial [Myxococcaceae bacterium]
MTTYQGARVAVLGGAGFLGSHLCERLLKDGAAQVVAIDNLITGSPANVAELERLKGFSFVKHDIVNPIPWEGALDFVFNMASPASPIDYAQLPIETLRVGSYGTENGLLLAEKHKAVFLQASTSEIYGDPLVHPQREDYWGNVNPIGPRSCYDESKRFSEALVSAYRHKRGVETRMVRIFNTYGPR